MQWLIAHWKDLVIALLAVDVALIPVFPAVPLFQKIRDFLTPIAK